VPVPALGQARGVGGPHHQMRGPGPDLLVTARAPVGLHRGGTGQGADHPVTVGRGLDPFRAQLQRWDLGVLVLAAGSGTAGSRACGRQAAARPARDPGWQAP
jgi:hypothetical protein